MSAQKVESIDFSILPYSFQCRLVDLTPPHTLLDLHQTCHTISKLTSRRGYIARSLFITNYKTNLADNYFNNIDDRNARYLTRDQAVTYKRIYVKNVLGFRLDTNPDNAKLWSLAVKTYKHVIFAEDAYSTLEIQNFIYPDLHIWEMIDSNAMQSIEGLGQLLKTWNFYYFRNFCASISNEKNVTWRLRRCPALRPSFYKFIETVLPQIMPDYHVVTVGELVTVKRKH